MSPSWQWVKANPDEAARKIRELGRENLALREALDSLRMKIAEAAKSAAAHGRVIKRWMQKGGW